MSDQATFEFLDSKAYEYLEHLGFNSNEFIPVTNWLDFSNLYEREWYLKFLNSVQRDIWKNKDRVPCLICIGNYFAVFATRPKGYVKL